MNLKVWMDRWMFVYLLEGISETETFVFFILKRIAGQTLDMKQVH